MQSSTSTVRNVWNFRPALLSGLNRRAASITETLSIVTCAPIIVSTTKCFHADVAKISVRPAYVSDLLDSFNAKTPIPSPVGPLRLTAFHKQPFTVRVVRRRCPVAVAVVAVRGRHVQRHGAETFGLRHRARRTDIGVHVVRPVSERSPLLYFNVTNGGPSVRESVSGHGFRGNPTRTDFGAARERNRPVGFPNETRRTVERDPF